MTLRNNLNTDEFKSLRPAIDDIADAVKHPERVSGNTHLHYKYPAGFSPDFPKSVIRAFSKPGDWILDPFVGGGTTLIEAKASLRNSVGIDVNELATFSATLKTRTFSSVVMSEVEKWGAEIDAIFQPGTNLPEVPYDAKSYFVGCSDKLGRFIYFLVNSIASLKQDSSKVLAKGIILRVCQLELDNRDFRPALRRLASRFDAIFDEILVSTASFNKEVRSRSAKAGLPLPISEVVSGDSTEQYIIEKAARFAKDGFKLVVTSPPYPGVHVVYHRWQLNGRKESLLPYYVIGSKQNETESFFTMGHRKSEKGLQQYFHSIWSVYSALHDALAKGTPVVQLLAFNNKNHQLDAFLQAMSDAGYTERKAYLLEGGGDGRIWRRVPNRKWYNHVNGAKSDSAQEVVLVHTRT